MADGASASISTSASGKYLPWSLAAVVGCDLCWPLWPVMAVVTCGGRCGLWWPVVGGDVGVRNPSLRSPRRQECQLGAAGELLTDDL